MKKIAYRINLINAKTLAVLLLGLVLIVLSTIGCNPPIPDLPTAVPINTPEPLTTATSEPSTSAPVCERLQAQGLHYIDQSEWKQATVVLTEAITCGINTADIYTLRGIAYLKQVDTERQIDNIFDCASRKVECRVPSSPKTLSLAIEDLTQAINQGANSTTVYGLRGIAYFFRGEHDNALNDLNQAMANEPGTPEQHMIRGLIYFLQENFEKALDDFSQVLDGGTDIPEVYTMRGLSYLHSNQCEMAQTDLEQALLLTQNPDIREMLDTWDCVEN